MFRKNDALIILVMGLEALIARPPAIAAFCVIAILISAEMVHDAARLARRAFND
jgi:hypothetical protein